MAEQLIKFACPVCARRIKARRTFRNHMLIAHGLIIGNVAAFRTGYATPPRLEVVGSAHRPDLSRFRAAHGQDRAVFKAEPIDAC